MLSENVRRIRQEKGLSQEELAERVHVVRQTVSKWEKGTSVPDADLLLALSKALNTPVSGLLGQEECMEEKTGKSDIREMLEELRLEAVRRKEKKRKALHFAFIGLAVITIAAFVILLIAGSPYLHWDYNDPQSAVLGTAVHAAEWLFVRIAPFLLAGEIIGAILTRSKAI